MMNERETVKYAHVSITGKQCSICVCVVIDEERFMLGADRSRNGAREALLYSPEQIVSSQVRLYDRREGVRRRCDTFRTRTERECVPHKTFGSERWLSGAMNHGICFLWHQRKTTESTNLHSHHSANISHWFQPVVDV